MRVRARSFLYLCLRIFFRRFLTTLLISLLPLVRCRPCQRQPCIPHPLLPPHHGGDERAALQAERTLQAHRVPSMGAANRLVQGSRDLSGLSLAHPDDPRMTKYWSRGEGCSANARWRRRSVSSGLQCVEHEYQPEVGVYFSDHGYKVKLFLLLRKRGYPCSRLSRWVSAHRLRAYPGAYAQ